MRIASSVLFLCGTALGSEDELAQSPHVTQLYGSTFSESVENGQPYIPVIFFHVDWCQHCKQTMPEFHAAADALAQHSSEMTESRGFLGKPKFFTFDCSGSELEQKQFCDEYVGTKFPSILALRPSGKTMMFNRPRVKDVIRWWVSRMCSFPVMNIPVHQLEQATQSYKNNPTYLMVYNNKSMTFTNEVGQNLISVYNDVAEDLMDGDYFFLVHDKDSKTSYLKGNPDQFYIGLLPTEWNKIGTGKFREPYEWSGGSREFLAPKVVEWAKTSKFPACDMQLTLDSMWMMTNADKPTVIVAHDNMTTSELEEFCGSEMVTEHRGNYFFGAIKVDNEEIADIMRKHYLLVRYWPHMFVTNHKGKETRYWEDKEILNLDTFSAANVEKLMNTDSALIYYGADMYEAMLSVATGRAKFAYRFAQEGTQQLLVVCGLLAMICWFLFSCIRAFLSSKKEEAKGEEVDEGKTEEKGSSMHPKNDIAKAIAAEAKESKKIKAESKKKK